MRTHSPIATHTASVISRFNIYDLGSIDLKIVILLDYLTFLITAALLHPLNMW